MRLLQLASCRELIKRIQVRVAAEVADYLLNKKRREIAKLEEAGSLSIQIEGTLHSPPEALDFICLDVNGNEVKFLTAPEEMERRRR